MATQLVNYNVYYINRFQFKINSLYLGVRCNTLHEILLKLKTNKLPFQEMNKEILRAIRIIDLTVYGLNLAKNEYTDYSFNAIIENLESMKYNLTIEHFTAAQQCIERILFEKNNEF